MKHYKPNWKKLAQFIMETNISRSYENEAIFLKIKTRHFERREITFIINEAKWNMLQKEANI